MVTSQTQLPAPAIADHETASQPRSISGTFRRLRAGGLSATEAGNLTARLTGIPPASGGWSVREIEHLLFLRAIRRSGRLTD